MRKGVKRKSRSEPSRASDKKKKGNHEPQYSKFIDTVKTAGITLSNGTQSDILISEAPEFKQNLLTSLSSQGTVGLKESVDEFTSGFNEYVSDPNCLFYALLPMTEDGTTNRSSTRSNSFCRILLDIECIQTSIATLLIDKLIDFIDSPAAARSLSVKDYYQIPKLILNQLRWLDVIMEGKVILDKLLEMIDVVPDGLQRDIIQALPEIINDELHTDIGTKLRTILEGHTHLTAACIDALSNLNISTELEEEILEVALERLSSSDTQDLPVLINYISHRVTAKNCTQVIQEMRERLDTEVCFFPHPLASSTPNCNSTIGGSSEGFVVLDALNSSLNYLKHVGDGWIKVIESIKHKRDHRVLDLFVLFVLHNISARRKTVQALFVSKVKNGLFSDDLVTQLFDCQISCIRDIFPSILLLCEKLLCSSTQRVLLFAKQLYVLTFTTFDILKQQEVVVSLVTHIGSGISSDCDCALDILESLVDTSPSELAKFTVFIKSILDYLEQLDMSQIHKLYYVLSALTYSTDHSDIGLHDDLHSIIRKQLWHCDTR